MNLSGDAALPRTGLVLGGGGARGLAHIGVLRVLEREGIQIDCLAGTSMGGLVGELYAAGVPLPEVEGEVLRLGELRELIRLIDVNISAAGLSIRGRRIYNYMADLLGEDLTFADLNIPMAMPSVDIITGRKVVMQGGKVIDAVRATISIPGIFEPAELADFRLVDGGVLDNVPVDIARELGATRTIAVDVLPDYSVNAPGEPVVEPGLILPFAPPQLSETYQVLMIMISALTRRNLSEYPPDVLIRPELDAGVTLLSGFHRATEIIAAGEAAAMAALPDLRTFLS